MVDSAAPKIAAFDVDYRGSVGHVGALIFDDWAAATALHEWTTTVSPIAEYVPGQFYKRELPCLLAALEAAPVPPDLLVVDGHAWLSKDRPGLGVELYRALDGRIPVIGVAKRRFHEGVAQPVLRGESDNPLWVSTEGIAVEAAVDAIGTMHGPYRIPTLLKRVDGLARGHVRG